MKTNNFLTKGTAIIAAVSLGLAFSCQETESPYAIEAEYVAEESVTDYYYEDADDMAGVAMLSESGTEGGKVSSEAGILTLDDDRLNICADISIVFAPTSTAAVPKGEIVIDFGDDCEDPRGNVRSGKIRVQFEGRRFLPESKIIITFDNYIINGITLNGTRVLTNVAESTNDFPRFRVYLNGTIGWPDGTEGTREHCYEREWKRADNPVNDELHVTQCANIDAWPHDFGARGINRRGVEYRVIIVTKLVYMRGCPIAVSGVKKFIEVATGKVITIDYGSGDCDRVITITVDGHVRRVNVGRR